ncbi:MAG: LamG-like jellyroll fold domain-containing protein [Candidatus Poribacteria bacterium]
MRKLSLVCFSMLFVCLMFSQSVFSAGIDPATIVGIWLLDDEKGATAKDSWKNAFDGQIKGTKQVAGKFGKALDFAKGDTVSVNLAKGSVTNKLTIILWLQFTDLSGQQNYFSIWDQSSNRYVPYKTAANELHSWANNWDVACTVFVSDKTWYHVANVYDGSKVTIYVNGEMKVSQAVAAFALADQQQNAWFATDKGGWISACVEDDIGIFNTPLTEENVKTIMNNGIAKGIGMVAVEVAGKLPSFWGKLKVQSE